MIRSNLFIIILSLCSLCVYSQNEPVYVYMNGSTIYNVPQYNHADGMTLKGILLQLPQVFVDSNNAVSFMGTRVESVMLNGGTTLTSTNDCLQHIPAHAIGKVVFYKVKDSDSAFSKMDEGVKDVYVMNVVLKPDYSKRMMLDAKAGAGTSNDEHNNKFVYDLDLYIRKPIGNNQTNGLQAWVNKKSINENRIPGQNALMKVEDINSGIYSPFEVGVNLIMPFKKGFFTKHQNTLTFLDNNKNIEKNINTLYHNKIFRDKEYGDLLFDSDLSNSKKLTYKGKFLSIKDRHQFTLSPTLTLDLNNSNADTYSCMKLESDDEIGKENLISIFTDKDVDPHEIMYATHKNAESKSKRADAQLKADYRFLIGEGKSHFLLSANAGYTTEKQDIDKSTDVRYFMVNSPNRLLKETYHSKPLSQFSSSATAAYWWRIGSNAYLQPYYTFNMTKNKREEERYYNKMPYDKELVLDAENSYEGITSNYKHTVAFDFAMNYGEWSFGLCPQFINMMRSSDLLRGGKDYDANKSSNVFALNSAFIGYSFNMNNSFELSGEIKPVFANVESMLEYDDKTDPNIIRTWARYGLKDQYNNKVAFNWNVCNKNKSFQNKLAIQGDIITNNIVQALFVDAAKGKRTIFSANTDNNWTSQLCNRMMLAFFSNDNNHAGITLTNNTTVGIGKATNIMGTDMEKLENYTINKAFAEQFLKLNWHVADVNTFTADLALVGDVIWQRNNSANKAFDSFSQTTFIYGITANASLPLNLKVATDFTINTRRGYLDETLNGSDLLWNMRLSYSCIHNQLSIILDAYDILRRRKNIFYRMTAQAYTTTTTNTVPSYWMLRLQFKL